MNIKNVAVLVLFFGAITLCSGQDHGPSNETISNIVKLIQFIAITVETNQHVSTQLWNIGLALSNTTALFLPLEFKIIVDMFNFIMDTLPSVIKNSVLMETVAFVFNEIARIYEQASGKESLNETVKNEVILDAIRNVTYQNLKYIINTTILIFDDFYARSFSDYQSFEMYSNFAIEMYVKLQRKHPQLVSDLILTYYEPLRNKNVTDVVLFGKKLMQVVLIVEERLLNEFVGNRHEWNNETKEQRLFCEMEDLIGELAGYPHEWLKESREQRLACNKMGRNMFYDENRIDEEAYWQSI